MVAQVPKGGDPDSHRDEGLGRPVDEGLGVVHVRQVRAKDVEDVAEGHGQEGDIEGEGQVEAEGR